MLAISLTLGENRVEGKKMIKTKSKLVPFDEATYTHIAQLRERVYPLNTNALPSIVRLWEDSTKSSLFYIGEKYSLIRFRGHGTTYNWVVGSNNLLAKSDWQEIKQLVTDSTGNSSPIISFISDNIFSDELRRIYDPKEMSEDAFEYIYDCREQATCAGGKFEDMRRQTRLYFKHYGQHTKITVDNTITQSVITKESVMHLFDDWLGFGTDGSQNPEEENRALAAFFEKKNRKYFGELVIIRIFYKSKLVAFSVNEMIDEHNAINHFHKSNLNLSGISYFTFFSTMEILNQKGVKYLNFQEDVGIPGLRAFKQKMRPAIIDKRYAIQL